jgi:hypothetical protein
MPEEVLILWYMTSIKIGRRKNTSSKNQIKTAKVPITLVKRTEWEFKIVTPFFFILGNLNKVSKGPQTTHAATTIQKNWRGHSARSNDDRVQELKDEVKNLRTDQHIRHLTKELSAAKLALERERKLRALQMDAIKV